MQNAENKSNKFVVLATYVVAVLCLLAGLFLPLFTGKEILALQLPNVFKALLGKGTASAKYPFTFTHRIEMFGIQRLGFDFMALVIVLYALVTALALLSFIPVAMSVRKEGKLAKKIYYGVEIAAVVVLSVFFVVALQYKWVKCYNMVIAACGTVIALLVLRGMDKGKRAAVNFALFILSAVAFLALFDYALLLSKEAAFASFTTKVSSAVVGSVSGTNLLNILFANNISKIIAGGDTKSKALIVFGAMMATVVLVNFVIDVIRLCTGKDKKAGQLFNIARYALEFILALCVLITALFCKDTVGLMLIVILAVALARLAIVTAKFVMNMLRKPDNERVAEESDEEENNEEPVEPENEEMTDEFNAEDYTENMPYETDGYGAEDEEAAVPPPEEKEDDGYISPEEDALNNQEPAKEETQEEPSEEVESEEELSEEIDYEIKTDGTYLLPADENAAKEPEEEPVEEAEPIAEETEEVQSEEPVEAENENVEAADEQDAEEEITEAVEEPVAEEAENIEEEVEAVEEEPVNTPPREEIKPYNPYERHNNNPFRAYEQSSQPIQPYNPYQSQTARTAPTRPAYEQKPVQPYERTTERPQTVRPPLQPRPIIQEFKPVPPISEQPRKEKQVYTIDKIYAGPIDDFIRKLTNDERIEFAMTFIEKSKGSLGSIPDYVVGGNNKKFFSLSFIYLGRVRGLVSDGLLNKMYKELNLL